MKRLLVPFVILSIAASALSACRIRSSSTPLEVDQRAPDFTLPNQGGQQVTLASLTANGPAVLVFNRGHR